MKKITILYIILVLILGCEKRAEKVVTYQASGSVSPFQITYLDKDRSLKTQNVEAESQQDNWNYAFVAEQGEIVYVSGIYKDINSGLKIMIIIDGKVYKQGSSSGDTINYLTVSGVIPY